MTSLDEDTAHAVIEVPNMRRPLTISQHNIEVVTEETYKKGLHQSRGSALLFVKLIVQ